MSHGWAVSPFPWFGGKQRLARRLVDLLPPHLVYVEAFGGTAAVLLTKPPARLEVYNDLDEGLVNFFRVLRDEPDELKRRLELTPFARREFEDCRDSWRTTADPIERARRWYVRVEQSFSGSPTTTGWGGAFNGRRHTSRAQTSLSRLDRLDRIARRLRTVQIECRDWREVLERYDGPEAVFYLDPTYVVSTRQRIRNRRARDYEHEMSDADHRELVERMLGMQASFLLSGYASDLYAPLCEAGFERLEFEVFCSSAATQGGRGSRTEVVWLRTNEASLFDLPRRA